MTPLVRTDLMESSSELIENFVKSCLLRGLTANETIDFSCEMLAYQARRLTFLNNLAQTSLELEEMVVKVAAAKQNQFYL